MPWASPCKWWASSVGSPVSWPTPSSRADLHGRLLLASLCGFTGKQPLNKQNTWSNQTKQRSKEATKQPVQLGTLWWTSCYILHTLPLTNKEPDREMVPLNGPWSSNWNPPNVRCRVTWWEPPKRCCPTNPRQARAKPPPQIRAEPWPQSPHPCEANGSRGFDPKSG